MLTALMTLLGSSTVGSLLGGVFAWLNRKEDTQVRKNDQEHEVKKWAHDLLVKDKDLEYARVEAESKKQIAFIEAEAVMEGARLKAITEANKEDSLTAEEIAAAGSWKWALVLASAYRKSMRSVLTTLVGGAAILVNVTLVVQFRDSWGSLTAAQQMDLMIQALSWVSAQASMMFGYWFVARGTAEGKAK